MGIALFGREGTKRSTEFVTELRLVVPLKSGCRSRSTSRDVRLRFAEEKFGTGA